MWMACWRECYNKTDRSAIVTQQLTICITIFVHSYNAWMETGNEKQKWLKVDATEC